MALIFLDREEEIEKVEEKYRSDKSEFVVLYGRRRIGKTVLIKKFIEEKKAFYFLCEKNKIELESERFLERFNRKFDVFVDLFSEDVPPTSSWCETTLLGLSLS